MKVGAEDRRQVETVIGGRTYRARNGYFDFGDNVSAARAHMQSGNLPAPTLSGTTSARFGYRCTAAACGRGSFFVTCGKCGSPAAREGGGQS